MTRKKKTRSLSRIHKVKTGNIKKLKREAGTDRQTGKRVKNKVKSAYEKFLEANPEAKEKLKQDQAKAEAAAKRKEKASAEKAEQAAQAEKDKSRDRDRPDDIFEQFERNSKQDDMY